MTMAGLEVEAIQYIGLPPLEGSGQQPEQGQVGTSVSGLAWEADKIVTASVSEVMHHPNADRLVLCKLFDGEREHIVLTGAPNLYPYKGQGPPSPLCRSPAREHASTMVTKARCLLRSSQPKSWD
jgi:phenylalanyl-tRNA synthetase beta chain